MITVSNLSKVYDKRGIAGLHGISFRVQEGEVISLLGPNGSGKTSLLRMLAGELQPEGGQISCGGPCVLFRPEAAPLSGNVLKFLTGSVTLAVDEEKKIQLARDLADVLEITFQLRQDLTELSAGQRQKVLLGSVLINHPKLLLLDEPFGQLDPFTRRGVLSALFTYIRNQGLSVLWVTHDVNEALLYSEKLAIMNHGRLEQWGTPSEVTFTPSNLFVAQFMGHKNILPVRWSEGKWQTPWGPWETENLPHAAEKLIVIPPSSWELGSSSVSFQLKTAVVKDLGWQIEARFGERMFVMQVTDSQMKEIEKKPAFGAIPRWADCFLVPL